jgi:hypothetical protein
MKTWLKFWIAQAASHSERRQRFALVEAAYPLPISLPFRPAGRRQGRGGRSHHSMVDEKCHE